ncbi:hypothetical protein GCK72_017378 [Caenorhabditis remanei]|uniref:Uncharacterized protein n=1 Tax=Caenorhabditis remanei TaxID=31234 RepID=A0A6A5G750_CAERE|nr:hypothetical protein GCK72_017378 [Caenorhabditis remanei]KAF1750827.1 hypothetical protein GCK72_017378 [Caenorhabditis remanei]
MAGTEKIRYCNMGIVDINGLNSIGSATQTSFSIAEVRKNNPSWGPAEPRQPVKYPVSPNIILPKLTNIIGDFSISRGVENRQKRNLRETIAYYVFHLESTKHLFCIHPRSTPEFYYDWTVLGIPANLTDLQRSPYPRVLIIVDTAKESKRLYQTLLKEEIQRNQKHAIDSLDNPRDNTDVDFYPKIMIGAIDSIISYLERLIKDRTITELASFLQYIVVNNAEKLAKDNQLYSLLTAIAGHCVHSFVRFIYMFNFATSQELLVTVVERCHEINRTGMYIEVDEPKARDLFTRVEFIPAVSAEEVANHQAAQAIAKENPFSEQQMENVSTVMTPQAQKLGFCLRIIQRLREERQMENQRRRNQRRERILIVTKDTATAILVMMFLRQRVAASNGKLQYKVNKLLSYDSVDEMERRNFEFRHDNLDVLVIDWRSIQDVNRGAVDAVIMFDSPKPQYFQTIMETEMENLTSRNCVKLKLYIFLNNETDRMLYPEYVKFLQKYKKKAAPQWFSALYEKFRKEWEEGRVTPEFWFDCQDNFND